MTSSNPRSKSRLRTPKPSDLADQFLELQRLRREVRALENANEGKVAGRDVQAHFAECEK